jgi:hypothetical protein
MRAIHLLNICAVMAISACSNYPSAIDERFGNSQRHTVDIQTVNPNAPLITEALPPSDGQSSKAAMDRYQKSFEVLPPASNVYNIGVGSGMTGVAR